MRWLAAVLLGLILVSPTLAAAPPKTPEYVFDPVIVPATVQPTPGRSIGPIVDARTPSEAPKRPKVAISSSPVVVSVSGGPRYAVSGHSIAGKASWYCGSGSICPKGYSGGLYAAAGPGLRAAMCGNQASNCWRGRYVSVNGSKPIRLVDWCQCYYRQPNEKLIDLFHDAWVATGAQHGVTITW